MNAVQIPLILSKIPLQQEFSLYNQQGKKIKTFQPSAFKKELWPPFEYYYELKVHTNNEDNCCINMYDENVFNVEDGTMIHIKSQSEDYLIDKREEVIKWFEIKPEYRQK